MPTSEEVPAFPPEAPLPMKPMPTEPTVKLAADMEPPTAVGEGGAAGDAFVNIAMYGQVFLPDKATQQAGFIPYYLVDDVQYDATQVILDMYRGTYIPFVPLGDFQRSKKLTGKRPPPLTSSRREREDESKSR